MRSYILLAALYIVFTINTFAQAPPANPPNPTVTSSNVCGSKTLTRTGSPPAGVQWYWHSVSNGTDLSFSGATFQATQSGTYYLRAYRPSRDQWSSGAGFVSVTVNQNPPAPATPSVSDYCSYGVLTRSEPPGGISWFWQGMDPSGGNTDGSSTYAVYSSGTYYIRSYNNSTGCWGASRAVGVSLTTPPDVPPTPLSSGSSCGDVTISSNGTPPQFMRWCWQTSPDGTDMTTMMTSFTVSSSGTFYYRAYDMNTGCWSAGASQITVNVNPLPPSPSAPSSQPLCGQVQLTRGTPPGGATWYWQGTSPSGTSTANSDANYYATSSGTYYLRARNDATGCWSTNTGFSVTVVDLPGAPSTPSVQPNCSSSVFTRGTPPGNVTWYWQGTNPSGTSTADASGTYTAYSLGTYYIRALNNNTGCWSTSSTGVSASFTPGPNVPPTPLSSGNTCGDVTLSFNGSPSQFIRWRWQTSPDGTEMPNMMSNYPVSSSGTYYLRAYDMNTLCWSAGASQITVTVNPHPPTPATPTSTGTCGAAILTRSEPPAGISWYWQGTTNFPEVNYTATTSGTYFLQARNNATGCWSVANANITVTVNPLPITPATPTILNNCGTGVIARSAPPASETWFWQGANASGTSTADANATYTVSSSGTYYLRARNNSTGCWSSTSSSVAITVNPLPATPAIPGITGTCGTGTLTRTIPPAGITWYWQGTNPSGTSTANSNTTYPATTSDTYYLRAQNTTTLCWSTASASTSITVNPAVGNPTPVNGSREEPGTVSLSAAYGTNGNNNKYYDSPSGGTLLSANTVYAPAVSVTTTYHVSSYSMTTGCESARVPITATVYPKPVINATGTTLTMGSTITLSVSNNTYTTYIWKRDDVQIANTSTVIADRPGNYTVTVTKTGMTGSGTSSILQVKRSVDDQPAMNYIIVNNVMKDNVTQATDIEILTASERTRSISYIGGLGNPLQSIISQASPLKKDIVQTAKYDVHGRQLEQYLPYISSIDDSKFRPLALNNGGYTTSEQYLFFQQTGMKLPNDTKPFSKTEIEPSPFNRMLAFTGAGDAWHTGNKKIVSEHLLNRASENIRIWNVVSGLPVSTTVYADYELKVNVITDENGNKSKSYTDKIGRTVFTATEANATEWLRTAYVYDDFGRLAFTITPEGVKTGTLTPNQAFLDQWAFQYKYDALGRLIEYKAPAGGWMYTIYDILNRPALTQNADQRIRSEWAFVKYDKYGRPVATGFKVIPSSTRISVQGGVDEQSYPYELSNSTDVGYTLNRSYPSAVAADLLSISYYDNYAFVSYTGWDAEAHGFAFVPEQGNTTYSTAVTGLPTGGKIRIIGGNLWLNAVQYYDKRYRPLQVIAENHLGGMDRSTNSYNNLRQLSESRLSHNNNAVIVLSKLNYDHAGRITKIYQNINSASTDQLVAQYEYNELGQLVDKKLHNTSGTAFLQSVDYRYNIRGWIASINNAQLNISTATNDEAGDYFGMEFLYNTSDSQLGNTAYHNGNIAAVKWKGFGAGPNAQDQRSYNYTYDKADRLLNATSKMNDGSAWTKEANSLNEVMTYDQNGNIKTLQRNHRKNQVVSGIQSYISETQDNLTYTYNTAQGNQLQKVEDVVPVTIGVGDFKNGANTATEYTYNGDGNLTADSNKGIDSVHYNILGKVRRVKFTDGRAIVYLYDAGGNKLKVRTYQGSTLQSTTDYVGGFVYENAALQFFGSPEGRVVKNGSVFEYQYALADHQGNTRVVFTSAASAPVAPKATFEGDANDNSSQFQNVIPANIVPFVSANQTPGGNKVIRLNQNYKTGPSKSVKVYPGDVVDMEVYAYYESASGYGTGNVSLTTMISAVAGGFGGVSGAVGEPGAIYSGVDNALIAFGMGANQGDGQPAAYLNYIQFDLSYNVLDAGWTVVPSSANFAKQKIIIPTKNIREAGYMFVYLSYENQSNNFVYFDDFKVTHTKTGVIQYNDYYPFGLQTENSWTREGSKNSFLYNDGTDLNGSSGWYETMFREYDPVLGRFIQVDPLTHISRNITPYHYTRNNPIMFNDPLGLTEQPINPGFSPAVWDMIMGAWNEVLDGGGGGGSFGGGGSGGSWSSGGYFEYSGGQQTYYLTYGNVQNADGNSYSWYSHSEPNDNSILHATPSNWQDAAGLIMAHAVMSVETSDGWKYTATGSREATIEAFTRETKIDVKPYLNLMLLPEILVEDTKLSQAEYEWEIMASVSLGLDAGSVITRGQVIAEKVISPTTVSKTFALKRVLGIVGKAAGIIDAYQHFNEMSDNFSNGNTAAGFLSLGKTALDVGFILYKGSNPIVLGGSVLWGVYNTYEDLNTMYKKR